MLKYALLGFLNYQPMTGYEIKQMIDVSTANFWHAKQSQIYTTLKKLEADNLAVSHVEAQEGRPDRRVYNITETGRVDLR
ncbi:MAG: PadR family transcriptional regulator, partial [Chloroflexi bacterium]|nr:PadR family transcriptional regulator [Chloroflexota bacterium]